MTNNYFKMFTITRLRETQIKLLWDATSLQSDAYHQEACWQILEKIWKKRRVYSLLVGMQINTAIMEFRLEISQKLETELPYSPNISLLSIYSESSTVSQRYLLLYSL